MFKTNARTKTETALSYDGMRLRLEYPQFLAECLADRVPYVMPSAEGGYLILAEYGNPCPKPVKPTKPNNGCGTSGGCSQEKPCCDECDHKKPKPSDQCKQDNRGGLEKDDEDKLIRFEVVKYSGYEEDGRTLIIEKRGVDGTVKQEWPVKTLVYQTMTGQELRDVLEQIKAINDYLAGLGCIVAVPTISSNSCGGWNTGQWRCYKGKYYRSKKDGNCTIPPNDTWGCASDFFDVLNLNCEWLQTCEGERLPLGSKIPTCETLNDYQKKLSDCNNKPINQRAVVACDLLDSEVFCKTEDGKITICPEWICKVLAGCAPSNKPPTAVITGVGSASSAATVSLSGASSSDSDGTVVSYAWSQVSGPSVVINNPTAQVATLQLPAVTSDTEVVLKLCVKDNDGAEHCTTHTISLTVVPTCNDIDKVLPTGANVLRNPQLDKFDAGYTANTNSYYGEYLNDWHQLWNYIDRSDFLHYFHSSWGSIYSSYGNINMPAAGGIAEVNSENNPHTAVHLAQILTTPLIAGREYMLIATVGGGTTDSDFRHVNDIDRLFTVNGLTTAEGTAPRPFDFMGTIIELGTAAVTAQNKDWQKVAVTFTPAADILTLALSCRKTAFDPLTGATAYTPMFVTDIQLAEKSLFTCP
jgi:hypothetical protein